MAIGAYVCRTQKVFKRAFNLGDSFRTDGSQFERLLTDAIWGEVDGQMGPGMAKLEGPNTRRTLQRMMRRHGIDRTPFLG